MTLTEFLLTRIAEDEAAAAAASPGGWQFAPVESVGGGSLYDQTRMIGAVHYEQPEDHDGSIVRHLLTTEANANGEHIARHDPTRVLAECAAKRAVVDLGWHHLGEDEYGWGMEEAKRQILALMAMPYVDHPHYRDEWRP